MRIGLLHPGEMGAAVGARLVGAGHEVLWCRSGRSARSARRAEGAGLRGVDPLAELLSASEVVLSICPPAVAEEVAGQVAGFAGVFVDANAISPQRMVRIAERLGDKGTTVVDGSIIGPPREPRVYLSGPEADRVSGLLGGTVLGTRIGDASALKMAFGSYNKACSALAAVSHALAEEYGVGEALLAEARRWGPNALAHPESLPSVAARAWRWGPELLEGANSFAAAGLPADLATGAAAVLGRWESDKDDRDLTVDDVLRHLRR